MNYQYSFQDKSLTTDLASGKVLFSAAGQPCLPVRLANEVFHLCLKFLNLSKCPVLLDPCCGSAYHITTVNLLNPGLVERIIANDMNERAISVAKKNLQLLTIDGLAQRRTALVQLADCHGKESHAQAVASAEKLILRLRGKPSPISSVTIGNAFDKEHLSSICRENAVNMVFTDVPYGHKSSWLGHFANGNPLNALLETLKPVLAMDSVVAIFSAKATTISHEGFKRVKKVNVGHRQVTLLIQN